jgi:aminocarboxymuconate-semialdehyde decarboxylase
MPNRREFVRGVAAAAAGVWIGGDAASLFAQRSGVSTARRQITIGGRRVKTIDVHAHVTIPEAAALFAGERGAGRARGAAGGGVGAGGGAAGAIAGQVMGPERLRTMDGYGIDIQALSINPFWYGADRALSTKLIELQNDQLAEICAARPDRFVPLASVALQHPDLAAQQLEDARKKHNMHGAAIGCSVEGSELSDPKFDPFWAKAQELQMLLFMHPQNSDRATGITNRTKGPGVLSNVIGNPLETTIALSHLIFDGTLDKFPNLRLCGAHGGGYLPSYADRSDHGCLVFPDQCKGMTLKKHPTEYLRQIYVDSLVFTPEALRHLVAVVGVDHIMIGTDYPFPWVDAPVDHVLKTPGLSDAERIAMAGGTAAKLLGIAQT